MKEIKITSNGIKQAIDDLVNENELLQDKVYKLEDILKEVREFAKLRKEMYERQENVVGQEVIISLLNILDKGDDK